MAAEQNAVSDDKSYDAAEAVRLSNYAKDTTTGGTPQAKASGGGSTTAGAAQSTGTTSPTQQQNSEAPGKRPKNPLGEYSSYTYQLSLYMITPEAHAEFINSGRRYLDTSQSGGAYIIAQSGGVNNETTQRLPGFEFDYYIDDLKLKNTLGGENNTSSASWEWSFNIVEPYGFSFLTKLSEGFNAMRAKSRISSASVPSNPNGTKCYFIMVIKFLGYDKQGKLVIKNEIPYERYYDIYFTSFKFTIDGKATIYKITAADIGQAMGMGAQRGQVNHITKIKAKTVDEAFNGPDGLITKLNLRQKSYTEQKDTQGVPIQKYANKYELIYEGPDAELIKNSDIIELDKLMVPMSISQNTEYVNDGTSIRSVPDFVNKTLTIDSGTPILQAIETVIVRSKYIQNAMKVTNDSTEEPSKNGQLSSKPNAKKVPLKWIRITCRGTALEYDTSVKDYAMKLTFVLTSYEMPMQPNAFASKASPYPGPYKLYEYWLTGQNTEVRRFEQTINNLYYLSDIVGGVNKNSSVAHVPGQKLGTNVQGKQDQNMAPESSIITSLQDIQSWSRSRLSILGDPDFLMQPFSGGTKYYGPDGFTINPNNSQVFIEIMFHEAVDYNHTKGQKTTNNSGLLTVNPLISFYSPQVINVPAGFKGVSFQVVNCESNFSRGMFTQELVLALNQFDQFKNESNESADASTSSRKVELDDESQRFYNRRPPANSNKTDGLVTDKQTPDKTNTPNAEQQKATAQNANPTGSTVDDAQPDVNTRLKVAFGLQGGREESLINRGRRILGIPVGGTGGGG